MVLKHTIYFLEFDWNQSPKKKKKSSLGRNQKFGLLVKEEHRALSRDAVLWPAHLQKPIGAGFTMWTMETDNGPCSLSESSSSSTSSSYSFSSAFSPVNSLYAWIHENWRKMRSKKSHYLFWTENEKNSFSFSLLHIPFTLPFFHFQCPTVNFIVI